MERRLLSGNRCQVQSATLTAIRLSSSGEQRPVKNIDDADRPCDGHPVLADGSGQESPALIRGVQRTRGRDQRRRQEKDQGRPAGTQHLEDSVNIALTRATPIEREKQEKAGKRPLLPAFSRCYRLAGMDRSLPDDDRLHILDFSHSVPPFLFW